MQARDALAPRQQLLPAAIHRRAQALAAAKLPHTMAGFGCLGACKPQAHPVGWGLGWQGL